LPVEIADPAAAESVASDFQNIFPPAEKTNKDKVYLRLPICRILYPHQNYLFFIPLYMKTSSKWLQMSLPGRMPNKFIILPV
jgi:hypothetical protein